MEDRRWNQKKPEKEQYLRFQQNLEDDIDGILVKGTKPLSDIYKRCNITIFELVEFKEVKKDDKWIKAMKEEIRIIEKSDT